MIKITQSLIFAISLPVLFACSESTNTESTADTATTEQENREQPAPVERPKNDVSNLNLSLPDEVSADQKTHIANEQPLMPELFDQEKTPSKYQLDGQVLLDEEQKSGAEALDGVEVRITIKK